MTTNEILSLWNSIGSNRGSTTGRRIDPEHPLAFFASYDEEDRMQLLLVTETVPDLPSSSKQIIVRANLRTDNKYAVCFSLTDASLKELFISLTWDMMNCTYDTANNAYGVKKAVERFKKWQKLFAASKDKMSSAQVKGLIGELLVLRDICIAKYGAEKAVEGWVGPLSADQDFQYEDMWYESKAVSASKDKVTISSFEQLDTTAPGVLAICRIETASSLERCGFTLKSLINSVDDMISANVHLKSLFHMRLTLYGYNEADDNSDECYKLMGLETYNVDDAFPRIARSSINAAVCGGSYELSIPAIQDWRM